MKSIYVSLCIIVILLPSICAQQNDKGGANIKELIEVKWNNENGITLKNYPAGKIGIVDYLLINAIEVAFLCKVEKKIKIYNSLTDSLLRQFSINSYPLKFAYDSQRQQFYILDSYSKIYQYSFEGELLGSFEINPNFKFYERLESINGSIYLLTADQNSFLLVSKGINLSKEEQIQSKKSGWILSNNLFGRTNITGTHNYSLEILTEEKEIIFYKEFQNIEKIDIGTIRILGSSDSLYYLLLDYMLSNNPNRAGRRLIVYSQIIDSIIQQLDLPNINFSLIRNDIKFINESIFHLLMTPQNAILFELFTESKNKIIYPEEYNYEYFDEIKMDNSINEQITDTVENPNDSIKQSNKDDPTNSDIMGSQIVDRAVKYTQLSWSATQYNIAEIQGNDVNINVWVPANGQYPAGWYLVQTPSWISTTFNNSTTPYKWGGWTHFDDFVSIAQSASSNGEIFAGDISCEWPYESSDDHVIGVDCSGYISRAWNRGTKLGTSTIPTVSMEINYAELGRGDALDKLGHHVRLFLDRSGDVNSGIYYCIESSLAEDAVHYSNYTYSELANDNYDAFRYNNRLDYDLTYCNFTIQQEIIYIGGNLTIDVDIENQGSEDFESSLIASVFDLSDNFVFNIGTEINTIIQVDEVEHFSFNTENIPSNILPGNYFVYIRFEKNTNDWSNIPNENFLGYDEIEILQAPPLNASFNASPNPAIRGHNVFFSNTSTGNATNWQWTFEGGYPEVLSSENPPAEGILYSSNLAPGIYPATLTISNATSSDSFTVNIYVQADNSPLVADFSSNFQTIQVGSTINFHDESSGEPNTWLWDIGIDGTIDSYAQNPTNILFDEEGNYDVKLTVTKGAVTDDETKTGYITVVENTGGDLFADFIAPNGTSVVVNTPVQFSDLTFGNPTFRYWTFEDATPSESWDQNPIVQFNEWGMQDVTLYVSNGFGEDEIIKENYINVFENGIFADFSIEPTTTFHCYNLLEILQGFTNPEISWFVYDPYGFPISTSGSSFCAVSEGYHTIIMDVYNNGYYYASVTKYLEVCNSNHCTNGYQDCDETAIDCGGIDCGSCGSSPNCNDCIKNGNETGVDCGGSCEPCQYSCTDITKHYYGTNNMPSVTHASDAILAGQDGFAYILDGQDVIFRAGNNISLKTGFKVFDGGHFLAQTTPCYCMPICAWVPYVVTYNGDGENDDWCISTVGATSYHVLIWDAESVESWEYNGIIPFGGTFCPWDFPIIEGIYVYYWNLDLWSACSGEHYFEQGSVTIIVPSKDLNTEIINSVENKAFIDVYPNPNKGIFNIFLYKKQYKFDYEILNDLGERVYFKGNEYNEKIQVDISNLPNGIYFLKVLTEEKVFIEKIIKQ
jgi:PKD repeat protein